ncbi:MAG: phage integrase SAM-like domain-containing protein [Acidobacteria bacterium]|nr:phage integrase SAM-like domain-containing protein [Acidobacteriota bacterium]
MASNKINGNQRSGLQKKEWKIERKMDRLDRILRRFRGAVEDDGEILRYEVLCGDERDRLIIEINKSHGQIQTGERMTFSMLADMSSKGFYKPAVLANGRKIEGVRSHNTAMNHLKVLKQFFGKKMVGQITTQSLRDYRTWRFKIGSRHPSIKPGEKKEVSISTINRELSAMRRIMRHAYAQGWITKDIFFKSDVIQTSAEIARKEDVCQRRRRFASSRPARGTEKKYERTRSGKTEHHGQNKS